jgi:hypothetical protein
MKSDYSTDAVRQGGPCEDDNKITRLLLLPDGRVLAHNLTMAMADILLMLDPNDLPLLQRGRLGERRVKVTSSTPSKPVSGTP